MTFRIEQLPDEPIIMVSVSSEFSVARDMEHSEDELRTLLDGMSEPVFLIAEAQKISSGGVDNLVAAFNRGARQGKQPLWHHPNLREIVIVSTSGLVKLAAKGVDSPIFGNLKMSVFDTPEEALAYTRSQLAE
jgi:hypothetical protein